MKIGVIFPQTEIGASPAEVREFALAVEQMGFSHISIYDHVVGASPANRPDWRGYSDKDLFHEPMVVFGYVAAITRTIELTTSILILPQRQTVLVAKQAAEVDVLSGGRLRLGVGNGWNAVEFEALGEDFHTRGRRMDEQIAVLRALWTQPIVSFEGKWHHIVEAGLNPMPVQQPIPIWMGGNNDAVLQRAARLADGWFPLMPTNDETLAAIARWREYAHAAGRDPAGMGMEALVRTANATSQDWTQTADWWRKAGATHLSINTMGGGLSGAQAHLEILRQVKDAIGAGVTS